MTKRTRRKRNTKPKESTGPSRDAIERFRAKHGGMTSNDNVAKKLAKATAKADGGVDLAKLRRLAERNNCWRSDWTRLNPGLQRMCAGNMLRAKVRRGESVRWEV